MLPLQSGIYLLCILTSLAAMLLMMRSYAQNRTRLLLWSALGFVCLAANNVLLFCDLVLLPDVDLLPARAGTSLLAVALFVYAFVWEVD